MYSTPYQKTQPLAGFLFELINYYDLHGNPARFFNPGSAQAANSGGGC
jgi:hypothetical protein